MTVKELKTRAKELKISGYSKARKAELEQMVAQAEARMAEREAIRLERLKSDGLKLAEKVATTKTQIVILNSEPKAREFYISKFGETGVDQWLQSLADRQAEAIRWVEQAELFLALANESGFIISCSPYSDSHYAHRAEDTISWGEKPLGSYRFADHWNWADYDRIHCRTVDGTDWGRAVAIMTEDGYFRLK